MARRPRLLAPGLVYHVIARGNHREPIFLKARDYRAYLVRLKTYRRQTRARLYAYCLMPNHVHLLETFVRKLGADPASVLSAERSWKVTRVRSIVAYTLVRRLGYPIVPVAAALGRAPTSVAVMLYRLGRRLELDPVLSAEVARLQQNV